MAIADDNNSKIVIVAIVAVIVLVSFVILQIIPRLLIITVIIRRRLLMILTTDLKFEAPPGPVAEASAGEGAFPRVSGPPRARTFEVYRLQVLECASKSLGFLRFGGLGIRSYRA